MDKTTRQLVDFTKRFSLADLPSSAQQRTVEILFDTIACALAGTTSEPARIVASLAMEAPGDSGATIVGQSARTSPELAALANAMMVRTYDYNDAYYGHPSDMIPGILAAAEVAGAPGSEVVASIALAYEIFAGLARCAPYHLDSWLDQGAFMNVAVALAAGRLWRLDEQQLANAASLSIIPNLPLGVCRWGELSMMKGASTAFAVRNGVFSAMLARKGFTSSPEPFEGIFGLHSAIGPFDIRLPFATEGERIIELAYIKPIPAENNTIGLLELVPEILSWTSVEAIDSIDIELATGLDVHLADEPKYDPRTRESADHSLPYLLARALVDGGISLDSYTPERVLDPALRPIMRRIQVRGSDALKQMMRSSRGPEAKPARIRITAGGREFSREILGHTGHPHRPAQQRLDMLNRKLDLCARYAGVPDAEREAIRAAWWSVREASDIRLPLRTLSSLGRDTNVGGA